MPLEVRTDLSHLHPLGKEMAGTIERYQKLGLKESINRIYDYPLACNELSFILRGAYSKVSKNLQALVFEDTLAAFRRLPEVQTRQAVSAANLLLQAAEVALPKQKKVLAVAEFKHAVVAHKRRSKSRQDEEGDDLHTLKGGTPSIDSTAQLPQDVLVHIFSFLDMRSLVAVGLVCWSWSLAASDNRLWHSQYVLYFGNSNGCSETKEHIAKPVQEKGDTILHQKKSADPLTVLDWKEAFKGAYIGNSIRRSMTNRGYCWHCKSIVWLNNMKCSNMHHVLQQKNQKIKPVSPQQIIDYILEDTLSTISSSDSEGDSDEESLSKLWTYPKHITAAIKSLSCE